MAIFKCDSCGYERDVPDKLAGKRAKCPDCGEGVTIVDDELVADLAAMFDEDVPEPDDYDVPDSGEPLAAIDLDNTEVTVELNAKEDVLCEQCGYVITESGDDITCPDCGNEVKLVVETTELGEDDLDVSSLTDDPPPQVWDKHFDDEEEDVTIEAAADRSDKWSLMAGSFPLNIFAGLISGALAFFFALAMSLLASSQTGMHEFLPAILSTALIGMGVGSMVYSLQSRIPFGLAGPGTVLTGVLFCFLGALYQKMDGVYLPDAILATLLAAIVVSSLVAAIGLWVIGKLGAGKLIRYVPIQIIGGVIAGVGVYIIIGALDWTGRLGLDWGNLLVSLKNVMMHLETKETLSAMGPSIVFGLILFFGLARYKNSLFLLGLLLVASAAGYGVSFLGPQNGLATLAAPIPELQGGIKTCAAAVLKVGFNDIQWDIIKSHGLFIGAMGCLIALTGMYRITRLELLYGREVDLDRELRALGLTNLVSGLSGGMPVAVSYGRSAGSYASGGRGPIAGIVTGLVCIGGLFALEYIIPLIPRFVPEGLLFFAAFALIRGWMFKAKTAFTRRDDLWMLWVTFFVTVVFGMLIGIGFGVALALMVTVRRGSRSGPVRNVLSGATHRSNVDRAPAQQRILKEYGDHIHIMRLQGFLALGSMEDMLDLVQDRLANKDLLAVEFLILDFKMVTGLASASGIGFEKLHHLVDEFNVELIIASAPLELEDHLAKAGHLSDDDTGFLVFLDLDYAMEWCENKVLEGENLLKMEEMELADLLEPIFPEPKYIPALMKVLKRVVVKKGMPVFKQGDVSDSMYFVESGRLDVELELEGGKIMRLKKVGPGAVFGEMGIYTMSSRSATVRATEKCVLYLMTTDKLAAVEARAPQLVTAIHRFMINLLADRLADANFKVRELMR